MSNQMEDSQDKEIGRLIPGTSNEALGSLEERTSKSVSIAVIDPRTLDCECLVRALSLSHPEIQVSGYNGVDKLKQTEKGLSHRAILYRIHSDLKATVKFKEELDALINIVRPVPVIVIGDSEDVLEMIEVFDCGARGYVPSSAGLEAIVEATRLSSTSGVFLPIASVQALRNVFAGANNPKTDQLGGFSDRQIAVCEALRRGKSTKTIAYELNLCESTVKVHIRTIMKKLNATNRTEAAFKLNTVSFGRGS